MNYGCVNCARVLILAEAIVEWDICTLEGSQTLFCRVNRTMVISILGIFIELTVSCGWCLPGKFV